MPDVFDYLIVQLSRKLIDELRDNHLLVYTWHGFSDLIDTSH